MSGHVQFGDDFAFSDLRAALVLEDGSIVRTLNGLPMTAGTSLFLRTPLEQAAPELLAFAELLASTYHEEGVTNIEWFAHEAERLIAAATEETK